MQTSCYYYWTQMIFPAPFSGHINEIYFGYTNFLEFFVFLFVRTRSSIKYFPRYITLFNVFFLYYINSYMYGAQMQLFKVIFWLTITVCFAFLEFFEVPAVTDWNPFHRETPSYQTPRVAF